MANHRHFAEPKLIIASHNQGKVREIDELLRPYNIDVVSAGALGLDEPEETGTTFIANAQLKARAAAETMAHEIARFPQQAVRADKASIIETRGMPVRDALRHEWANGVTAIINEGVRGAARFADGAGRHGDFKNIQVD